MSLMATLLPLRFVLIHNRLPSWIIKPKLGHAVKCLVQVGDINPGHSHLPVIFHDVLWNKDREPGLTGRIWMKIDPTDPPLGGTDERKHCTNIQLSFF